MTSEKIDIVYTWCDGSDPEFRRTKNECLKKHNITVDNNTDEKLRYQNNDELKYSLRSVEKYAPWANHIYIVTNNQRPEWLKDNDKITIVDHKEIIPADKLPTFNSVCIENYLVNIPDLSDHFLYFNDDIFLTKMTKPEDFFVNGKPIVRLNTITHGHNKYELSDNSYKVAVLKSYCTVLKKNQIYFPYTVPTHGVDAYSKEMIIKVNEKYPQIEELNTTCFRTNNYLQRVIYSYEMAYSFGCPLNVYDYKTTKLQKLLIILFNKNFYYCVEHQDEFDNLKRSILFIKLFKPFCCCFNNCTSSELLLNYLKRKFPHKSSYES